jgi:hypothetical protein
MPPEEKFASFRRPGSSERGQMGIPQTDFACAVTPYIGVFARCGEVQTILILLHKTESRFDREMSNNHFVALIHK